MQLVQHHIESGGNSDVAFQDRSEFPREDGSTDNPLCHTGEHLLNSIDSFNEDKHFGVDSTFVGAAVLHFGTVGKGGELPTIVPVNADYLSVPIPSGGGKRMKMDHVDIYPRPYMGMTDKDKQEIAEALA